MRSFLLCFAIVGATTALSAGAPDRAAFGSKLPWQWSDEERIAARLDPVYIRDHTRRSAVGVGGLSSQDSELQVVIDGRQNPELLLPYELFNWLMGAFDADPALREQIRASLHDRLQGFGPKNPDTFWAELESVSSPHLALVHHLGSLGGRLKKADRRGREALTRQIDELQVPMCRSRADALAAARLHFGGEAFEQLLYSVVAPQLTVGIRVPTPDEARELAFIQGGCR
jgi:hypothetical protein